MLASQFWSRYSVLERVESSFLYRRTLIWTLCHSQSVRLLYLLDLQERQRNAEISMISMQFIWIENSKSKMIVSQVQWSWTTISLWNVEERNWRFSVMTAFSAVENYRLAFAYDHDDEKLKLGAALIILNEWVFKNISRTEDVWAVMFT